jgi:hypothetical protein
MSKANSDAARKHLANIVATASDTEIDEVASQLHLGITISAMIDGITQAKEALPKMGIDPDDEEAFVGIMAKAIMSHKASGDSYSITVAPASAAQMEKYRKEMEKSTPLP